jgi:hypothetical protein
MRARSREWRLISQCGESSSFHELRSKGTTGSDPCSRTCSFFQLKIQSSCPWEHRQASNCDDSMVRSGELYSATLIYSPHYSVPDPASSSLCLDYVFQGSVYRVHLVHLVLQIVVFLASHPWHSHGASLFTLTGTGFGSWIADRGIVVYHLGTSPMLPTLYFHL